MAEILYVHKREKAHHHVVVAETEVGAPASAAEPRIRLGDNVLDYGRAACTVGKILSVALVIVCFPECCIFFPGKEALRRNPVLRVEAVHPGDEHIEIEEHLPNIPSPKALLRLLEQAAKHVVIVRELPEKELFGAFSIGKGEFRSGVAEGIRTHIRPCRLDVERALVGIDLGLGGGRRNCADTGGHTDYRALRRRRTGIHPASFPEGLREVFDHSLGYELVLFPAKFRKVPDLETCSVPELFQIGEQGETVVGQIAFRGSVAEHIEQHFIGLFGIGIA